MKVSVALPIHNMEDAHFFLTRNLTSLENQTFKDFEVVITDNSPNRDLKVVVDMFDTLNTAYFPNDRIGMAKNTNRAIKESSGDLIKILYLDDYLMPNALENAVANIGEGGWLASGCLHADPENNIGNPHLPRWNDKIHEGANTIGSPSVVMIRNEEPLLFDETMSWLLDCDYYKRMHERYGEPILLNSFDVVMGTGKHQMTNLLTEYEKSAEYNYIMKKYDHEQ